MASNDRTRVRIALAGVVQGVGFRPFVHNLARALQLDGWVLNSAAGLFIEAEGPRPALNLFLSRLDAERPPAALVLTREVSWLEPCGHAGFRIVASEGGGAPSAGVLPDLATCPECLAEMRAAGERRCAYAFTNCTRCGPRFSIIEDIPYDRPHTTMRDFVMCDACRAEYENPADRRFHAQPIACPRCGPRLTGTLAEAAAALAAGRIVALKGIGGYQLLVDARNQAAVERLRARKRREAKPLAVMAPSLAVARGLAQITPAEEALLVSAAAPIVLLRPHLPEQLAPAVRGASPYLGVMLPYSPLHHLLLGAFPFPVVATSGNLSDEPIATENTEAHARLDGIADAFLEHNRRIARPCDDSLARVVAGREIVLRRARGYAPLPVLVGGRLPRILAVGAHLKNTVAITLGDQVVVSQHIGDLDTPEARAAFERAVADLCRLWRFTPDVIACDLHPDYYSSQWAAAQGKPLIRVQHHMAHAASCAAENDLRGAYLGVSWDGTGYGLDGTVWGGEMFLCEGARMERVAHLRPFLLPGGDLAAKQCWRPAAALRWALGLSVDPQLARVLERRINAPQTTSMGRLFDAVAALAGVTDRNGFEGEAGLRLEAALPAQSGGESYPLPDGDWGEMVPLILERPGPARVADLFHNALAAWIAATTARVGVRQVALSGGCFQNAALVERTAVRLEARGVRVATHQRVPPNDGGVALGQAVLAAAEMLRSA